MRGGLSFFYGHAARKRLSPKPALKAARITLISLVVLILLKQGFFALARKTIPYMNIFLRPKPANRTIAFHLFCEIRPQK
jgi:hypothetical protein